ncbi:MAG: hypothetical protein ACOC5F_03045 [Candidatus Aminicenantaceae bacterium]
MQIRKTIGFLLGPLIFVIIYVSPLLQGKPKAHSLLCIFALVVVWWVTECIPIPVTALLAPVLITLLGIDTAKEAFAPFATPPNCIIYGSGLIKLPQMIKFGFWLNIAGIIIIWISIGILAPAIGII